MLAQLYMKQGRLDEARVEFEGMVKRDPRAAGPRTMVGVILEVQGKRDEAKAVVRGHRRRDRATRPSRPTTSRSFTPKRARTWTWRSNWRAAPNRKCRTTPRSTTRSAGCTTRRIWPTLAVGPLEESLKKMPDNPDVLYHLGLTYAKLGDNAKARDALERALKLNPQIGRQ